MNSDVKQFCHPYIAWQKILVCCYCTDKSLDVCIFVRFKVNCEIMLLRSWAIFKLIMSRHRNELRGTLGHDLFGRCVNPSLFTFVGPKVWSSIPNDFKSSTTFTFKWKKHFLHDEDTQL